MHFFVQLLSEYPSEHFSHYDELILHKEHWLSWQVDEHDPFMSLEKESHWIQLWFMLQRMQFDTVQLFFMQFPEASVKPG
jgi:hypothetical protein